MAKLYPAESTDSDSTVGGFIVLFPGGACKSVAWRSEAPIQDTLAAAKEYATKLVQAMLDEQRIDDLDRTNMPSLVAAIQKLISDWNEKRRRALYASPIQ
jgi:hypothetical protein